MILGTQGKPVKVLTAHPPRVACFARERPRTPIRRRHGGAG
jgi:hypothetical protein